MMRRLLVLLLSSFFFSATAYTALYEWTDEKGVQNFTDNLDIIPPKYLNNIKKRPSIKVGITAGDPAEKLQKKKGSSPDAGSESEKSEKLIAGHDESWWRYRFTALRNELKVVQDSLTVKKNELLILRRQMTPKNLRRSRKAMYDKRAEIESDDARVKDLGGQLNALDADAAKEGVPAEWRQ